jgi:hypothetical protein
MQRPTDYHRSQKLRGPRHSSDARHKSGAHYIPRKRLDVAHAPGMIGLTPQPSLGESLRRRWANGLRWLDGRLGGVRRAYLALAAVPAFAAGALFGLVILGWWVWPVQWIDASMGQVRAADQALYVQLAADMFAIDHNEDRARRAMYWDAQGAAACGLLAETSDPAQAARLAYLAMALRGGPCDE